MRPVLWAGLVLAGALAIKGANAQIAVQNQGYVPYSEAPIHYRTRPLIDPVALLQKDLDRGAARLTYYDRRGYLRSVLKALRVPEASQTLVFSKTSFQFTKINPEHPRALYYNDDVYVGSVHQGKTIEIVSFDPMQGAIFYLLDDQETDKPVFRRAELDCTQCHIAAATRGVPGVLLRSVFPAVSGVLTPRAPQYITDQKSPLKERWGGWYVSGALANPTMANRVVTGPGALPALGPLTTGYNAAAYLTPDSDGVALLVLGHQAQMHNLVTLLNYQTRLTLHAQGLSEDAQVSLDRLPEDARQKIIRPAEQLLRYMLFSHEAPLGGADAARVIAASPFARQFAAQGPRDPLKRSLRDFDLHDRIFRYPCSYLIYSTAFDALPEPGKTYLYHRLFQVLSGQDQGEDFAHLTPADRQAILAILRATKRGLPEEWRRKISPNPVSPT